MVHHVLGARGRRHGEEGGGKAAPPQLTAALMHEVFMAGAVGARGERLRVGG